MSSFKEYNCDICGSADAVEMPHCREYTDNQPIHICKNCGFIYVRNRRSAEDIAKTWSEKIYGSGYTALIPAVVARQNYVAAFIEENLHLKGKYLCDIGAGEGQFLDIARKNYSARPFGIEPSKENCKFLSDLKIENFPGTIEDFVAASKTGEASRFDIVTVMWTLENCMSCNDMIMGARDLLKDDGHIVIATGSRILVPFKKPLHLYLSTVPADTNSFRFSARTLKGLLAKCGFEVTHMNRYIDTDWLVVIAKKRPLSEKIEWDKDNYRDVVNFFERWHNETQNYFPPGNKNQEKMVNSSSSKTGRSWQIQ